MGNTPTKGDGGAGGGVGDASGGDASAPAARKLEMGNSPARALAIFQRRFKKAEEALASGDAARAKEKAAGA